MKIRVPLILPLIFCFCSFATCSYGQEDRCDKRKVAVVLSSLGDEEDLLNNLNTRYPGRSRAAWIGELQALVLQRLQSASPNVEFVPFEGVRDVSPIGFEYFYSYSFDDFAIDHEAAFSMSVEISQPPCGFGGRQPYTDIKGHRDIYQLIDLVTSTHGSIGELIRNHERKYPVPPKGPVLHLTLEPDHVSPLKEERSMEYRMQVTNCRGELVYDNKGKGQLVILPRETERGEFTDTKLYPQNSFYKPGRLLLGIYGPQGASTTYKLRRGIDAQVEKVEIETCGIDRWDFLDIDVKIHGLEVELKPDRKTIYVDERTDIEIYLKKVSPDGDKTPVANKVLNIEVTGINNGSISPRGEQATDSQGMVKLRYKAGSEDKKINISAIYQPVKYPNNVKGRTSINVKPLEYDATIFLKKRIIKEAESEKEEKLQGKYCTTQTRKKHQLYETHKGAVYISLKLEQSVDMPILNQRWEYYRPKDINLSYFEIISNEEKYDYANRTGNDCAGGGHRLTKEIERHAEDYKIEGEAALKNADWIVVFDNKTNKAVKILPAGYGVNYYLVENETWDSEQWSSGGREKDADSVTHRKKKLFELGPVEDPVPDPTVVENPAWIKEYLKRQGINIPIPIKIPQADSENIKKPIPPDILVDFGDGRTYFGGQGNKETMDTTKDGFYREEQSYIWQMTRKRAQ